jgi:hypothetical protein
VIVHLQDARARPRCEVAITGTRLGQDQRNGLSLAEFHTLVDAINQRPT